MWSKMWGGKKHWHIIQAMEWLFDTFNVGAETLFISHDYQFVTQFWLRYMSWICHPDNPSRRFKRVAFAPFVNILLII